MTTNTIIKNDFRNAFVYDIIINEDTSFYDVMDRIHSGLSIKNTEIFGEYIKEYADNPNPSSYYLKINVIDATGHSEFYKCSIIKSFEYSTGEYEIYFACIISKKICTKEVYNKLDGSLKSKIDFIGQFLEKHFIFKEDREECKDDECFCCGCGICEAEDKEEEELDEHIVKGESVKKEYDKIKEDDSRIEDILNSVLNLLQNRKMNSSIKSSEECNEEIELIKKLCNNIYSLNFSTTPKEVTKLFECFIKEDSSDKILKLLQELLDKRKGSKKE